MAILELSLSDERSVVWLWTEAGLARPWNDPSTDFRRAMAGVTSTVLGLKEGVELIGTVMAGSDGHRGWVYYLAVREANRHQGHGRSLLTAAEEGLRANDVVKVQLMVRSENSPVMGFYAAAGYEHNDVQ